MQFQVCWELLTFSFDRPFDFYSLTFIRQFNRWSRRHRASRYEVRPGSECMSRRWCTSYDVKSVTTGWYRYCVRLTYPTSQMFTYTYSYPLATLVQLSSMRHVDPVVFVQPFNCSSSWCMTLYVCSITTMFADGISIRLSVMVHSVSEF